MLMAQIQISKFLQKKFRGPGDIRRDQAEELHQLCSLVKLGCSASARLLKISSE